MDETDQLIQVSDVYSPYHQH